MKNCIQKIGIYRYNAYQDTGSDLSFTLAILDESNNGVVLNGIYSREMSNIYAKAVEKGTSIHTLSEEEKEAIQKAINQEEEKRPYELFNEIINELIAQDISEIMHKKNIFIFDNPKLSKYNNSTSYEHSLFLVKEFFNEFKDKIIASRRNGQIHIILDEVGKENFDELNSLFEIYFENFSGFKIYNLLSDLKDNKDTEQTRIYNDLVARKDKIMEKMRTHQANKKEENYESQVTI